MYCAFGFFLRQVAAGLAQPIRLDVLPLRRERDGVIVIHLGQIDRVRHVLAFRVDADLALGGIEADVAFGDDLAEVVALGGAVGALDHFFIEINREVGVLGFLVDVGLVRELGVPLRHERLALASVGTSSIQLVVTYMFAKARRLEALVLVGLADVDGAAHRDLEVRGRGLLVIGGLCGADQQRDQDVGLGFLDVLDGRGELRDAEGDELLAHHGAALFLDDVAHPFGGDLAEIVIGGDRVNLLAELLHHPRDQRRELLFRHGAGDDHVRVADAALVLIVVECEPVELIHDRAIRLPRRAREPGEHHIHLIPLQHAAHEFLVARVVRLRVVDHQFQRSAGDAALGVDLFGGELDAVNLADGREREIAGLVLKHAEFDRVGRSSDRRCHRSRHQHRGRRE